MNTTYLKNLNKLKRCQTASIKKGVFEYIITNF